MNEVRSELGLLNTLKGNLRVLAKDSKKLGTMPIGNKAAP